MKRLRIKPELESPEINVTDGPYSRTFRAEEGAVDFSTDARTYAHELRLYSRHDYVEIFDDASASAPTPTPALTLTPAGNDGEEEKGEEEKGEGAPTVAPQVAQPKEQRKGK